MRINSSPSRPPLPVRRALTLDAVLDDPRVGLDVIERQPIFGLKDEQLAKRLAEIVEGKKADRTAVSGRVKDTKDLLS